MKLARIGSNGCRRQWMETVVKLDYCNRYFLNSSRQDGDR